MGIGPFSNHGLNCTTLKEQGSSSPESIFFCCSSSFPKSIVGRNNNSNNNPTTICSSQEVYIESLGLPYYALAAWTHCSFIIGSPLLENYDPRPYKRHQRFEEARPYKRCQRHGETKHDHVKTSVVGVHLRRRPKRSPRANVNATSHRSLPTSTKWPSAPPQKKKQSVPTLTLWRSGRKPVPTQKIVQGSEEREAKQKKAETKKAPMKGMSDNISVTAGDTDDAEVFHNNDAANLIKLRCSISKPQNLEPYASKDNKESVQKISLRHENNIPLEEKEQQTEATEKEIHKMKMGSTYASYDDSDYNNKHFTQMFSVQVQRYSLGERVYHGDLKFTYDEYTQSLSIDGKPKMKVVRVTNMNVVIFEILLTNIDHSKLKPQLAFQSGCIKTSLIVEFSCKSEVHLVKEKLWRDMAKLVAIDSPKALLERVGCLLKDGRELYRQRKFPIRKTGDTFLQGQNKDDNLFDFPMIMSPADIKMVSKSLNELKTEHTKISWLEDKILMRVIDYQTVSKGCCLNDNAIGLWIGKHSVNIIKKKMMFIPINYHLYWSLCVLINLGAISSGPEYKNGLLSILLYLHSLGLERKEVELHVEKWLNNEWNPIHANQ
eukprot:jgi/Psemu1/45744/gm1.45744_g